MTSFEAPYRPFATDVEPTSSVRRPCGLPTIQSAKFPTENAAATKIQSRFRGQQARSSLAHHSKDTTENSVIMQDQHAATVHSTRRVQGTTPVGTTSVYKDAYRNTGETTQELCAQSKDTDAALQIQRIYRGTRVRMEQARRARATSLVLSSDRSSKGRNAAGTNEHSAEVEEEIKGSTYEDADAATRIQRFYRRARRYVVTVPSSHRSLDTASRHVRSTALCNERRATIKGAHEAVSEETAAAVRIQRHYRRRQSRLVRVKHREAAVVIQKHYCTRGPRGIALSNDPITATGGHADAVNREAAAAVRIQNSYRAMQNRMIHAQQTSAASVIQRRYRNTRVQRVTLSNGQTTATKGQTDAIDEETDAARRIQTCYRKRKIQVLRAQQTNAVLVIQGRFRARMYKSQRAVLTSKHPCSSSEHTRAAVRIQSLYRGNQVRVLRAQQIRAVTQIQVQYRAHKARAQCAAERQRQDIVYGKRGASARLIQQRYREWCYRNKHHSILVIQRKYRMHHKERVARVTTIQQLYKNRFSQRNIAAAAIQRCYRKRRKARRIRAACFIQARYKAHYGKRATAAKVVQQAYKKRKHVAEVHVHCKQTEAATSIQRRFREQWDNVGGADQVYTREDMAAVTIGARWRGRPARVQYQQMRDDALDRQFALQKLHQQATVIQRHARAYLAHTRSKQVFVSDAKSITAPESPRAERSLERHVQLESARLLEENSSLRKLLRSSVTSPSSPPKSPITPMRPPCKPAMEEKEKWAQMSDLERLAEAKAFTWRLRRDQLRRKQRQEHRDKEGARLLLQNRALEQDVKAASASQRVIGSSSRGKCTPSKAKSKLPPVRVAPIPPNVDVSSKRSVLFGREAFDEVTRCTDLHSNPPATCSTGRLGSSAVQSNVLEAEKRVPRPRRAKPTQIPLYLRMERVFERQECREKKERAETLARILRDPDKANGRKAVGGLSPVISPKTLKRRRTPPKVPRPKFKQKPPSLLPPLRVHNSLSSNVCGVASGAVERADMDSLVHPMSAQKIKNSSPSNGDLSKSGIPSSAALPALARPQVPSIKPVKRVVG